ncbi:MAG: type II toxin-antitoxin system HipA family toxin [Syntrophales bacterium]|jgi:serine/threonine-protein kinase HipA|nr:type II toxin-antitoxin system HipA family toxin [Syntrophales bacterium]
MYKPVRAIEVRIWGKAAGAVALDPKLGYYAFEYDPRFVMSGIELAPLTMPLTQAREPFVFTDLPELTFKQLPALLADALPDEFGNNLIDAWMASRGVAKSQITSLDRLAYMGKRGMGALEFKPARGTTSVRSTAIKLSHLIESARSAVHGEIGSDQLAKAALAQIIQVGTSAGGARAKAAIAWNPTTDEIRSGQFDVEPGFEHWLLKFDGMGADRELGGTQDYGRIEYAYFLMARAAGIAMSPSRLLEEEGRAHFMTQRFDRDGNKKHHLQTLCAIAHMDYKQKASHDYNQLFLTIKQILSGYHQQEEAFRRMAFNVMAANCDDHTKNISFILREGKEWELAPAYDVTHAHNPQGEWTSQHLMAVNGKFSDISRSDLLAVADRFGIGTAPQVLKQVVDAVSSWPDFAVKAGLGLSEIRRILDHHHVL